MLTIALKHRWAPVVALSAYLLGWVGKGLFRAVFYPDDMMNIYRAWERPAWRLVADVLLVWTNDYRASGAIILRMLYEWFGLNPLPFRLVCFLLLMVNIWLVYEVAQALAQDRYVAFSAGLVSSYHPYLSDLYLSSATVYELVCFAGYWGALLVWLREGSRAAVIGLALVAVGAKEMALTLPVALLAASWVRKRRTDWRTLSGVGLICAVSVASRIVAMGKGEVVAEYVPEWSVATLMERWAHYLGMLLGVGRPLALVAVVVFLAGLGLVVAGSRQPWMRLGALLFLVAPLPVLLIAPRSLYVFYLAYGGLALVLGGVVGRFRGVGIAVFLVALTAWAWRIREAADAWTSIEDWKVERTLSEFRQLGAMPKGGSVLVTDDSIPIDDFFLTLTLRLLWRDAEVQVWRVRQFGSPPEQTWTHTVSFRDWRLARAAGETSR